MQESDWKETLFLINLKKKKNRKEQQNQKAIEAESHCSFHLQTHPPKASNCAWVVSSSCRGPSYKTRPCQRQAIVTEAFNT